MENIFNPNDWLPEDRDANKTQSSHSGDNTVQVEEVIKALEQMALDITAGYSRWRDIGFALADEFAEGGREFFHRISRFNAAYEVKECDQQYTNCLNAKGSGITLATFFHYAKEAGIAIRARSSQPRKHMDYLRQFEEELESMEFLNDEISEKDLSVLPEEIFNNLPDFLRKITDTAEGAEERDVLLLGAITTLSSCLGNFQGYYLKKLHYPNIYFFLTAQASAGKGSLNNCRRLVYPIHWQLIEESKIQKKLYEQDLAIYNTSKDPNAEKPDDPKRKMLFLPANSSSTGIFQLINDNDGRGLLFETEADTISNVLSTEYGNYSDGFRKAFHHEMISYYRKTNDEHVEIHRPQLSTVLSGTPNQVVNLIKNSENGLFSRFLYYYMNFQPVWKDTFANEGNNDEEIFNQLGSQFYNYFQDLREIGQIEVVLTEVHRTHFTQSFSGIQQKYLAVFGKDFVATIRRLGLISFRIMMVLTALRLMEWPELRQRKVFVSDNDYSISIKICEVLLKHGAFVYSRLPAQKVSIAQDLPGYSLLLELPSTFETKDFVQAAKKLKLGRRQIERYISRFKKAGVIRKIGRGKYSQMGVI